MLTASERKLRARIGAHAMWAKNDPNVVSQAGRNAARDNLNARLLAEIDPDNKLSTQEQERRLQHARRAHFARLAMKASRKRSNASADTEARPEGDRDGCDRSSPRA